MVLSLAKWGLAMATRAKGAIKLRIRSLDLEGLRLITISLLEFFFLICVIISHARSCSSMSATRPTVSLASAVFFQTVRTVTLLTGSWKTSISQKVI